MARVLAAAGMAGAEGDDGAGHATEEVVATTKALCALVGGDGAPVPIAQQVPPLPAPAARPHLFLRTHARGVRVLYQWRCALPSPGHASLQRGR